jgi:hypothetical protein
MNKFTVFFLACMLIMSQARPQSSYEIYDISSGSQVKIPNGAVLTRSVKTTDTDYSFALQVKNSSTVMCVSWVRKYYVNILTGTTNWFCWDGCYFPNVMVCKSPVNINPGQIFNGFDAHYNAAGMQGQSRVKYVVYNGANRNDSTGFEVIFLSSPTGTDEYLTAGLDLKAHPNPAGSTVKFTLPEQTVNNAFVVIKNVVGQEICRIPATGNSKEIIWDVSAFSNGIYFYSLELSGLSRSAYKLIIQH